MTNLKRFIVFLAVVAALSVAALAGTFSDGDDAGAAVKEGPGISYQHVSDGGGCRPNDLAYEYQYWMAQGGSIKVIVYFCDQYGRWIYAGEYWQSGG